MIHAGLWLTGIIFIILKLAEAITWSWWIVASPFLISVGWLVVSIIFIALATAWLATSEARKRK